MEIIVKDGVGEIENPYQMSNVTPMAGMNNFESYHKFKEDNPPLPVYFKNGDECHLSDNFEVEEWWQVKTKQGWTLTEDHTYMGSQGFQTRKIYLIIALKD